MINKSIKALINYGLSRDLFEKEDEIFVTNRILEVLCLDEYEEPETVNEMELEDILKELLDFAVEKVFVKTALHTATFSILKLWRYCFPAPARLLKVLTTFIKKTLKRQPIFTITSAVTAITYAVTV